MRKLAALFISISLLVTGCGAPTGNERPDDKKLRDSLKLLTKHFERNYSKSVNWNSELVKKQIDGKLPKGFATEAGWTLKWPSASEGELPQAIIPWEILGQFPTNPALDIKDYVAGRYAPQSVVSEIARLELKGDPYFAAIVNVKMSNIDNKWVAFTSVPYLPVTDPAYGWANIQNGKWQVIDFGTATVGCGKVPNEIQKEFGFSCP